MGVVRTGEDSPEICPRCRLVIRREYNFCPSCGERLQGVCSACRTPIEEEWAFCANCGTHRDARAVLFAVAEPVGEGAMAPVEAGMIEERAEAHNSRGSELYDNDEFDEAVREFGAAVSLVPGNAVYRTNLAVALSEMGDFGAAVREFREAIRLEPGNASAYLQLGYTYQEMHQLQDAIETWRKAIDLAPDSDEADEAREAIESI